LIPRLVVDGGRNGKRKCSVVPSVGMFGKGGGWGIGPGSLYATSFLIGGITEKPGVING
jgi:hypothetical protein